ncbi:carbohydrate ABC transporter permease, partial [Bacillus sp. HC-TM]
QDHLILLVFFHPSHARSELQFYHHFFQLVLIPWEATMVPNFLTIQNFGWINSFAGMTVPFFATAFGIFLLRQHFMTLPNELKEAAFIEGIGNIRFLFSVVIPYCKTSFITLGVYSFLTTWNMYLWPLLVTTDEKVRTVQIGVKQLQSQEVATDWGSVMAINTYSMLLKSYILQA